MYRNRLVLSLAAIACLVGCDHQPGPQPGASGEQEAGSAAAPTSGTERATPQELESVFHKWVAAAKAGDLDAFKKYMSSNSYASARNQALSLKREFPGKLPARLATYLPDLSTAQRLGMNQKGRTATLVYLAEEKGAAGEKPTKTVAVVTFVNEGGQWRFHAVQSNYGDTVTSVEKGLAAKDQSFLKEAKFMPPAAVPVAPAICAEPDYVATYSLTSYGYEARLTVNGATRAEVAGKSKAGLLIGGLKQGKNTVKLTVRPVKGAALKKLDMSITARNASGKAKKVVSYKAGDEAKDYEVEFEISGKDFAPPKKP